MTDVESGPHRAPVPLLTTRTARGGNVSFDVPAGWDTIEPTREGGVVAAVEPDEADRFRTNVVVAFGPVEGTLADWATERHRLDEAGLDGYLLLDHEEVRVAGHHGWRRLATYSTPARESVTCESWSTLVEGTGVTLTARVATLRLPEMAGVLDAIAASVVVRAELVPA